MLSSRKCFCVKIHLHSHDDDKVEATIENTEHFTGGIVEDSEDLVFNVSQEQICLAQSQQTKQSVSDVFSFSSEEFPTQLLDSSSQFVPEFLSTPKDPSSQFVASNSTNEDDSETPTQLADSQYFITY